MKHSNTISRKLVCIVLTLAFVISMISVFSIGTGAYQSAFKSNAAVTEFSQEAKDKMAAMADGDNIFALGSYDTATYSTPALYCESGLAQFVYQHNDNKWGRAYKGEGWAIDGMAKVGDGVIDGSVAYKGDGLYFGVKTSNTVMVNANAEADQADSKYFMLCGWEFAADFTVDSFKIYFGKAAYADDFDILIGHIEGDDIVWEVAFTGDDMNTKFSDASTAIYSYTADFNKTYTGRFVQLATKSFDGNSTELKSGYYGYFCPELEVYSTGAGTGSDTTVPTGSDTTVPTEGDTTVPTEGDTTVPTEGDTTVPGGESTTVPGGESTTVPGGESTTVPGGESTTVPGGESTTVPGGNTDNTTPVAQDTTKPADKTDDKKDSSCKSVAFIPAMTVVSIVTVAGVMLKKRK